MIKSFRQATTSSFYARQINKSMTFLFSNPNCGNTTVKHFLYENSFDNIKSCELFLGGDRFRQKSIVKSATKVINLFWFIKVPFSTAERDA